MFLQLTPSLQQPGHRASQPGQAGEEVGEGGLGQKTQEAGPEQPQDPLSPHFRKEERTQTGDMEHAGGNVGNTKQQGFAH